MKNLLKMLQNWFPSALRVGCVAMLGLLAGLVFFPDAVGSIVRDTRPALSSDRHLDGLIYAIIDGDNERAQQLLTCYTIDINVRDNWGITALVHATAAAGKNGPEVLRMLIEHGANVNFADDAGTTPLLVAVALGQKEAAELLLKAGADPNARRDGGKTILHLASSSEPSEKLIDMLLAAGADPNARDASGNKPSDDAREVEADELVRILAQAESAAMAIPMPVTALR